MIIAVLLAAIVLLLIVIALRLGRLSSALRRGTQTSEAQPEAETPADSLAQPVEETSEIAVDSGPRGEAEDEAPVAAGDAEPAGASPSAVETGAAAPSGETTDEPFEKDGRWWYRIEGELLVYDEERGEWRPAEAADEVAAAPSGETSDEPFEKDGRWWYRMEGELLVYDEQRAEWRPAGAEDEVAEAPVAAAVTTAGTEPAWSAPAGDQAAPVETSAEAGRDYTHPLDEPRPEEAVAEPAGVETQNSHWRCPSCGVINGSTATTCRMCFTARP